MDGILTEKDILTPSYINLTNPKYIEIDEMFYSCLLCINYYRELNVLILKSLIDTNININIYIFYEKQDTYKTIKELTYHIWNIGELQDKYFKIKESLSRCGNNVIEILDKQELKDILFSFFCTRKNLLK